MPDNRKMTRKIGAIILLTALLVVPFLEWRLGAIMWLCAWMVFIMQKLFTRNNWKLDSETDENQKQDE